MPKRRVFISYQHKDQMKAKGLNLMRYNEHLNVEFVGRHLLDPVDSSNNEYITRKIKEQLSGTSATVVLLGAETADSEWVAREIEWSREKGNGIVGIRIDPKAEIPEGLTECGAEILDWFKPEDVHEFDAAIERAIAVTSRGNDVPINSESTCKRAN